MFRTRPSLHLVAFVVATTANPILAEEQKTPAEPESGTLAETVVKSGDERARETRFFATSAPSGLKSHAPLAETPRSVSVITRRQIEDRGVQTIQDALVYSPGVYGATYGFDTRGDWSLVRAVAPLDYLDGLRSHFGYYNNTRPHPYSLSSIEVIKGPASVLYGQSSLGGILNATSKDPLSRPYNEAFLSYGSHDRFEAGLDVGGEAPAAGLSWRLVGLKRESDTQVDHVPDDTWFIMPSVTWQPAPETTLTLLANLQESRSGTSAQFVPWEGTVLPGRRIPSNIFLSEPGFDRYLTDQKSVTGIVRHRFNETWGFEARVRYTDSSADYRSIWPAFPPTIDADGFIDRTLYASDASSEAFSSDARLLANFATGQLNHQAAVGFDYQHAETDNDFFYSYLGGGRINIYDPVYGQPLTVGPLTNFPSTTFEQTGFYVHDRFEVGSGWVGTAGMRYDELKTKTGSARARKDDALTFDAGLMYRFGNGLAPYASYAESFLPVAGTDSNNKPFEPREGRQYEVGLKYQPPGSESLFTVALFDTIEKNRLTAAPNGVGRVQTGEVEIQGVELEAQTRVGDFHFQAGYSYIDAEISSSNDGNEGFKVASVPAHQFSTWVTWRPTTVIQGFKAGAGLRHVGSSYDGADTIRTPSYTLLDAMVGYETGPWDFTVHCTNLTDKEHVTTALARGDAFFGQRRFAGLTVRYKF